MLLTYDLPEFPGIKDFSNEYNELFIKWCHENNALYYARPKEDFSEAEALDIATADGYDIVLLENLS